LKILLDENLPHQLRHELPGHEVFTVAYMNWAGLENGKLLQKAASEGFGVVITNDRGLEYEQNLTTLPVSVITLIAPSNTIETIRTGIAQILELLNNIPSRSYSKIEIS
jgi:predicted nuclease of predicted toxin-antitoxin system